MYFFTLHSCNLDTRRSQVEKQMIGNTYVPSQTIVVYYLEIYPQQR